MLESICEKVKRFLCLCGCYAANDIKICKKSNCYEIIKGDKIIKLSLKHGAYVFDVLDNFDYYFEAVEPDFYNGQYIIDYSVPAFHKVRGYDIHEIIFPSIPELIETAEQYLEFAQLNENSVILDLGAYSGLTSILFDYNISKNDNKAKGKVISVEPDLVNLSCLIQNISEYKYKTNRNIEYAFAAVSDTNGRQVFLSDGAMGANSNYSGVFRNANKVEVPAMTLSALAKRFNLDKIDFIKCDIEGAEKIIFNDDEFFNQYSPKIIVEVHNINCELTTNDVIGALQKYGYTCELINQNGSKLPLLGCIKKQ